MLNKIVLKNYLQNFAMLCSVRFITFVFNGSTSLLIKNESKVSQCIKNNLLWRRMINVGTNCSNKLETEVNKPRKKTEREVKITLIYPDDSMTVTFYDSALKIAKRRNLQLVQVTEEDPNTGREVYKLLHTVTLSKIIDENKKDLEQLQKRQNLKGTKLFTIKAAICEHDLNTKVTNINKVLKKNYTVKVLLTHPNGEQENVLKILKDKVEGKVNNEEKRNNVTALTFFPLDVPSDSSKNDNNTE